MRSLLLVALLVAPAWADEPPAELLEGGDQGLPCVRVLAYGPGFLGADDKRPLAMREPPDPIAADSLVQLRAISDLDERVAVLLVGPEARLIVHVPGRLLATVARANAYVYASPADELGKDPGRVKLRPGITLAPEPGPNPNWRRVRYRTPDLEVAGVVRADRIGHVYPETSGFLDGGDAEVRGDARVLASPGGATLATLTTGPSRWLQARKLAIGHGYLRVSLTDPDVVVEGWVKRDQVREVPAFGAGGSWASGSVSGFTGHRPGPKVDVKKGTLLRATPGGVIVGIVARDGKLDRARSDPGRIVLHTVFGDAELVAEGSAGR